MHYLGDKIKRITYFLQTAPFSSDFLKLGVSDLLKAESLNDFSNEYIFPGEKVEVLFVKLLNEGFISITGEFWLA